MVTSSLYALASGMMVILATGRPDEIAWRFLRLVGFLIFGLITVITLWSVAGDGEIHIPSNRWAFYSGMVLAVAAAALAVVAPLAVRLPRTFRVLCTVGGGVGLIAAVVTVGTINAGSAPNVIPETASLSGTLRAIDPDTRQLLHDEVRRVTNQTALAHNLSADVNIELGPPPIVNRQEHVAWARQAVSSILGDDALVPLGTLNMGGEDFAYYLEKLPGCFLRIGAREPGGDIIPAHTPRFYAPDESIFVGAAVLAETARVASAALAG